MYIAIDHAYFIKLSSILQGENDEEKIYQSGVLSRLILKHTISQQRMWKTFWVRPQLELSLKCMVVLVDELGNTDTQCSQVSDILLPCSVLQFISNFVSASSILTRSVCSLFLRLRSVIVSEKATGGWKQVFWRSSDSKNTLKWLFKISRVAIIKTVLT